MNASGKSPALHTPPGHSESAVHARAAFAPPAHVFNPVPHVLPGHCESAVQDTAPFAPPRHSLELKVRSGPLVTGNEASVELVAPVTYAAPVRSRASRKALSSPSPPMNPA